MRAHFLQTLPLFLLSIVLMTLCLFSGATQATETYNIGLYQNPPKIFRNKEGEPTGFFVDILNTIANREGWELNYIDCVWDKCLQLLEIGDIDLMPDVAYSQERDQRLDFHREVVLSNWTQLYARDYRPFHSILDLNGKRLAVIAGSIQYQILKKRVAALNVKPDFIEFSSSAETMEAVSTGHADAALVNRLFGRQAAERYDLEATHILVDTSHLYYATKQGHNIELLTAIDQHLSEMKANAKSPYYRALTKWIEPLDDSSFPLWLLWLAEGLFVLLLLLSIHILILKRVVRRNIRELEQRNTELSESESMFRTLFETSADAMVMTQGEQLIDANPAMLRLFGYPDIAALQSVYRDGMFPPTQAGGQSSRTLADQYIQQAFDSGYASLEFTLRKADGSLFPSEVTLVPMSIHGKAVLQATIRDISQRKLNEQRLQHLNRALQTLSKVNHILVHAHDESDLLNAICRTIVEGGGYRLAWVGFAQYDDSRSVTPVAEYGFEEGYLSNLRISWKDNEYGRGPTGTAIRTGQPAIARDIHHDPRFEPWRGQALERGYASSIALPLKNEGFTIGALNIYSTEPDAFDEEELALLLELADDLAFGIHTQRLRLEHTILTDNKELDPDS